MKKRLLACVLVLILCLSAAMPVLAAEEGTRPPCVRDQADLLTEYEEDVLAKKLESIAAEYAVELVVVTVDTCDNLSHEQYAAKIFDGDGYGLGESKDGVLLLIDMDPRNRGWYILTNGLGYDAVSNSDAEDIGETITPYLKDGDYADAFHVFAEECETLIDIEINGEPFDPVANLVVSLVIGLVIALIATGVMKGKLKSVHSQYAAENYVRPGSMNITESRDIFLYRQVHRREKPKSSSSGGSSGSRRGGAGGSF